MGSADAGEFSLRQLTHFVAVAETGTISAAAERLHMSPSALSGSITELERLLGAELCVRRRAQGVTLTPLGRQVLDRARTLLRDAAELGHTARGGGAELTGPLGIGCFVTLAPTVLPGLLTAMEQAHPRVALDFLEGPQDLLREALLDGRIDAAVLYDMGDLDELDSVVLFEARGYALFGADHPLAGLPTVPLRDLAAEPLVLFDQPPSTSYAMAAFEEHGLVPTVRHRTHSFELTRSIVARGRTYAILVQRPTNKSSYEGLPIVEREVDPPLPTVPVVLAWPAGVSLSPRARALADLARQRYGAAPPG
ncbi:LysR family transcriptional regulator [Modestobacter sp. NPDC049651]|uniref:LysR family transcriptional regulator n=1 Tax=unclassified Modestobacter TaxID=2643866 RepID=UPI0033C0DBD8